MELEFKVFGSYLGIIAEAYATHLNAQTTAYGLDRYQLLFMHICEHSGETTQSKLCELTGRDKVYILRAVDYLQCHGFVERRHCTNDRRTQWLVATEKAMHLKARVAEAIRETNKLFVGGLRADERRNFVAVLSSIYEIAMQVSNAPSFEDVDK